VWQQLHLVSRAHSLTTGCDVQTQAHSIEGLLAPDGIVLAQNVVNMHIVVDLRLLYHSSSASGCCNHNSPAYKVRLC
jgi:hypothetical protein